MDIKAWYREQRATARMKAELEKAHPVLGRLRPWLIYGYTVFLVVGLATGVSVAYFRPDGQDLWAALFLGILCFWYGAMMVYEMLSDHLYKMAKRDGPVGPLLLDDETRQQMFHELGEYIVDHAEELGETPHYDLSEAPDFELPLTEEMAAAIKFLHTDEA